MKFFFMLCFAMCSVAVFFGQNTETDSLKKSLAATKEENKRVSILESLSYAYLSSYPDTALQYALEGLQLAKNIKFREGEILCTNALGNVYFHMGDYVKALQLYFQYLEMRKSSKERRNLGVAYFNLASVYTETEDYRNALVYLLKAKEEDEKVKDSAAILYDLYSLSSIYLRMEKPDSALENLNQSYQLAVRADDKNMLGAILNTFGEAYLLIKDTTLAGKYFRLSIPYAAAIKDNEVLTANYYGIARIFARKNMVDSSVYYSRKALLIAREAPFLKQVLTISSFLTDQFRLKKQFDSAFYYQQLTISTKDSLFNIEQVKKVQNIKFGEQQKQQAIETANIRYRNNITLFIVIAASVVFLGIAIVLWRNNKQKQLANTLLQQQKEKVEFTLAELKQTQAQLIQSEKMASLGELTAGIAHEIQNPLNFVNNFSEVNKELLLEMRNELDKGNFSDAKEIANDVINNEEKINHHGKRADAIVKGMLQHSRSSSGVKELTDINVLADEYFRLAYHGLRAKNKSFNATMKTDFEESLEKINIIPQDIGRVLLNLYNNAFYAVSEKKKQKPESYEPTVSVRTKLVGKNVAIIVADNGNGVPRKVVDKIFQPFFTTKPTGQGTGLGLSLSYDIIRGHGGEIKINTTAGEGAEFIIQLPVG